MPRVVLASAVARWLTAVPTAVGETALNVEGGTIGEVLAGLFAVHPQLRSYLLDETGGLRHHVIAYVDGEALADKRNLCHPVSADSDVYLFQALSGG